MMLDGFFFSSNNNRNKISFLGRTLHDYGKVIIHLTKASGLKKNVLSNYIALYQKKNECNMALGLYILTGT